MDEQARCPTCGRFLELDPDGFYDAGWHDPKGCNEFEADVLGAVAFCTEACADRFHQRAA